MSTSSSPAAVQPQVPYTQGQLQIFRTHCKMKMQRPSWGWERHLPQHLGNGWLQETATCHSEKTWSPDQEQARGPEVFHPIGMALLTQGRHWTTSCTQK